MGYTLEGPDFPEGCAIVFGGTGGVGTAIAGLFTERSVNVVLTYHTSKEKAEVLAAELTAAGSGRALALHCDTTNRESVRHAVEAARQRFDRLHTAISATGALFPLAPVIKTKEHQWRTVLETDVIGFFNISQVAIAAMRETGGGSIVAITSAGIAKVVRNDSLSAVPKTAVDKMVKHIANEEAVHGIRANGVGLGGIDAGQMDQLRNVQPEMIDAIVDWTPLGRLGLAAEVAEAVHFLASNRAGFTTGQMLLVDGGMAVA